MTRTSTRSSQAAPARLDPTIDSADSMQTAAAKVLATQLSRLVAKEAGTRSGADPEELHDIRVAVRRARAALRFFRGRGIGQAETDELRRTVGPVAERLGEVRDLDVLLVGLEAYRQELSSDERFGLDPLRDRWTERRDLARARLIDALDAPEYAEFLVRLRTFAESKSHEPSAPGVTADADRVRDDSAERPERAAEPVRDAVPARTLRAFARVRSFDPAFGDDDVAALHQVRIAARRLRYTLEFFADALGKRAPRLIADVIELQDQLGATHDADVGRQLGQELLDDIAVSLSPRERTAIAGYVQSRRDEIDRQRREIPRTWRIVTGRRFHRRLYAALRRLSRPARRKSSRRARAR